MDLRQAVEQAIQILKDGGVIIYPTDTVWGLGCDATNEKAVERIYKIKQRTEQTGFITLAKDIDMVCRFAKDVPEIAEQLIEVNDKPLTIIYQKGINLAKNVLSPKGEIAMRVVDHPFCNLLLKRFNKPIVSTSARIKGDKDPIYLEDISEEIISQADWCTPESLDQDSTGIPSSIVYIGQGGVVKIIRD